ncbi:MAG TPA: PKD domain-containing protein, partial [Gemmatimonadales bacterium]
MRSIRLLAATTVIAFGAWSCGDDGGGVGTGSDPLAAFTLPTSCAANTACTFTDTSSDPDGANTITTRHWDFGDGQTVDNPGLQPSHTYTAATTYTVTLTVTDNSGKSNVASQQLTVTGGTTNGTPVASMDAPACTDLNCTFHSTSTDDVGIVSTEWDFGEAGSATNTASGVDASHSYAAAGTYTVTLTVTDGEGLQDFTTQTVTVTAPVAQDCTAIGLDTIDCALSMTSAASQVVVALTAKDCQLVGNRVFVPPPQPAAQDIFLNTCFFANVGDQVTLVDDGGATLPFAAGSQLHIRFRRGTGTPAPNSPAAQLTGSYPNWTIKIDDGGDVGQPRDFNDVELQVTA